MDEATLRFLDGLGKSASSGYEWSVPVVSMWDVNDLLKEHLPNLRFRKIEGAGYELVVVATEGEVGDE